jgi:diacylglycerol kinase
MTTDVKDRHPLRRRVDSFVFAFAGWRYVLRTQPNAWVHATISLIVFALALWLNLSRLEWAILLLTTALVWVAECANTALEVVVDMAMPDYHHLAKTAKDVAAAAVLAGALGAALVGLLILGPPLWGRLFG